MARIVLSNLAVFLAIYLMYCYVIPEFIPEYRSYLPLLAGAVVSLLVSYLGVIRLRPTANRLLSIAVSALCAFLVAGASLAAMIATKGS